MKLNPLAFFISLLLVSPAFSQTVIGNFVSADQHVSTGSYSIHWTVGELITGTFTAGDQTVLTSGLQITNNSVITAFNPEVAAVFVQAYPNPFSETLTIVSDQMSLNE